MVNINSNYNAYVDFYNKHKDEFETTGVVKTDESVQLKVDIAQIHNLMKNEGANAVLVVLEQLKVQGVAVDGPNIDFNNGTVTFKIGNVNFELNLESEEEASNDSKPDISIDSKPEKRPYTPYPEGWEPLKFEPIDLNKDSQIGFNIAIENFIKEFNSDYSKWGFDTPPTDKELETLKNKLSEACEGKGGLLVNYKSHVEMLATEILKELKEARESSNKTVNISDVLNDIKGWGGTTSRNLGWLDTNGKNQIKELTDSNFKDLYNNNAQISLHFDETSKTQDWNRCGALLTERLFSLGNNVLAALTSAGLDNSKLAIAMKNVINEYLSNQYTSVTSTLGFGDQVSMLRRANSLQDTPNGIMRLVDETGINSYLFTVDFKDFVDDILNEYNSIKDNKDLDTNTSIEEPTKNHKLTNEEALGKAKKELGLRDTNCKNIYCQAVADDGTYKNQKHYFWDANKQEMIEIPGVYHVSPDGKEVNEFIKNYHLNEEKTTFKEQMDELKSDNEDDKSVFDEIKEKMDELKADKEDDISVFDEFKEKFEQAEKQAQEQVKFRLNVLEDIKGWGGTTSRNLGWLDTNGKNQIKELTDSNFNDLYNNNANISLHFDETSKTQDWNRCGNLLTVRLFTLGNSVVSALTTAGLDKNKLVVAMNNVINEYVSNQYTSVTSSRGGDDQTSMLGRANSLQDTPNGIMRLVDESGINSYLFTVNFKNFVDDILAEYQKLV